MTDRFAANRGADIVRWYKMAAMLDEKQAAARILTDVAAWAKENGVELDAIAAPMYDEHFSAPPMMGNIGDQVMVLQGQDPTIAAAVEGQASSTGPTIAAQGERKTALHAAIMNLPCNPPNFEPNRRAYREGHKDARHAAADLVFTIP